MMKEKKIILLGQEGMLGQMVNRYFIDKGFQIKTCPVRFDPQHLDAFIHFISETDGVIINAIGKIKQKTNDINDLLFVNTILPSVILENLKPGHIFINPSTDCVFDGKKGEAYMISDPPNVLDAYGWSKRLAEVNLKDRAQVLVPRVSIIGLDSKPDPKGLLGWFMKNPGRSILNGFTNHYWNGITTLEWCKQIHQMIENSCYPEQNIFQLGTRESYTKYEMLKLFNQVWKKDITIEKFEQAEAVDRRLMPEIICKPLPDQLLEMKNFWDEN